MGKKSSTQTDLSWRASTTIFLQLANNEVESRRKFSGNFQGSVRAYKMVFNAI